MRTSSLSRTLASGAAIRASAACSSGRGTRNFCSVPRASRAVTVRSAAREAAASGSAISNAWLPSPIPLRLRSGRLRSATASAMALPSTYTRMVRRLVGAAGSKAQPKMRPWSIASTRPLIDFVLSCSGAAFDFSETAAIDFPFMPLRFVTAQSCRSIRDSVGRSCRCSRVRARLRQAGAPIRRPVQDGAWQRPAPADRWARR